LLSNTDRDFIDASIRQLGVPFELAIVASEIGSYKPAHTHWQRFFELGDVRAPRHRPVAHSPLPSVLPPPAVGLPRLRVNPPWGACRAGTETRAARPDPAARHAG